jgi:hypothetical protein
MVEGTNWSISRSWKIHQFSGEDLLPSRDRDYLKKFAASVKFLQN